KHGLPAQQRWMANIVLGGEEIRRPRRLAFWIEAAAACIDLVFVRIEELGIGNAFERQGELEQGIGPQQPFLRERKEEVPASLSRQRGERGCQIGTSGDN